MKEPTIGTQDGTWVSTCACGAEKRIKNLSFRITREATPEGAMCTNCREARGDGYEATVALELDLCGCADEDRIDALMLEYLGRVERLEVLAAEAAARHPTSCEGTMRLLSGAAVSPPVPPEVQENNTDAMMLMSHLADRLEWIEHGSDIRACWLTTGGKEALAILRVTARPAQKGETDAGQ